jgi:prepilin-type N-terminal cleavage/methylation domain-containing protein/prepilin-type processing-associated H-X9-DG protein
MKFKKTTSSLISHVSARRAFTLVEVIVVILILGILLAFLLPAVQYARESARRTQCFNNLRQTGLALAQYHETIGMFPSAYNTGFIDLVSETGPNWGWGTMILGHLEQKALFNSINFHASASGAASETVRKLRVDVFLCPSSASQEVTIERWEFRSTLYPDISPANYIGSAGTRSRARGVISSDRKMFTYNSEETGVLFCNSAVTIGTITDGASQTFLVGERSRNLAPATWFGTFGTGTCAICTNSRHSVQECVSPNILVLGHTGPKFKKRVAQRVDHPNNPSGGADGFSSEHGSSCNFLFCDGSVKAVKNAVDPKVYAALSTRSSGESIALDSY